MNQCLKSEEAELNIHPIVLILSEMHVNLSFCNNAKTLRNQSNWTHTRGLHVPRLNGDLFSWTGIFLLHKTKIFLSLIIEMEMSS